MSMNVSSISSGLCSMATDTEYQRIIRELRALGIEPTGDKSTDKSKLAAAQASQSAQSSKSVQDSDSTQSISFQVVDASNKTEKNQTFSVSDDAKASMSACVQNMTGAEQISQFNKYKLLGIC